MTNDRGPTVSVTSAFPVFTDEKPTLPFSMVFLGTRVPFQAPETSAVGNRGCSVPGANVPNGADGVCT
jgi:hypothetical protein